MRTRTQTQTHRKAQAINVSVPAGDVEIVKRENGKVFFHQRTGELVSVPEAIFNVLHKEES